MSALQKGVVWRKTNFRNEINRDTETEIGHRESHKKVRDRDIGRFRDQKREGGHSNRDRKTEIVVKIQRQKDQRKQKDTKTEK